MNKVFIIILYIFLITTFVKAEIKTDIVLTVNDKIITNFDIKNKILSELLLAKLEVNQNNIDNAKDRSLSSLIDLQLKKAELEKFKATVQERELKNYIKVLTNFEFEELKNLFISNDLDWMLFLDEIKVELLWRRFIFDNYNSKIDINIKNIEEEINKLIKEKNTNEYRLSEIEFLSNDSENYNDQIIKILKFIEDTNFETAVTKFSNSQSKFNKGDLGWIKEKSFSKEIIKFIKDLEKGEISKPLVRGNTITIFKLIDKKESNLDNIDKNSLRENLINFKKNELFKLYSNSHLSKLKNNSLIVYK